MVLLHKNGLKGPIHIHSTTFFYLLKLSFQPITVYSVLLWFPSPSHSLLCAVFSLKDSRYAHQYAQISVQDVFYRLQIAFSQLPTAEKVPEFCHVHSKNSI